MSMGFLIIASLYSHDNADGACSINQKTTRHQLHMDTMRYSHFNDLAAAIREGNSKEIEFFVTDITSRELRMQDEGGRTLLMIAIENGQEPLALYLIKLMDKDALTIEEGQGLTALGYAYFYRMTHVAEAISKKLGI